MPDTPRIEELRRRIDLDPASVIFADLAEEYRREHRFIEAIHTCRLGLARHPRFLSARVTLGRCLMEINDLESAQAELEQVRRVAPTNIGALQALAGLYERKGLATEALDCHRAAVDLARHAPTLKAPGVVKALDAFTDRVPATDRPARPADVDVSDVVAETEPADMAAVQALERFLLAVQTTQDQHH